MKKIFILFIILFGLSSCSDSFFDRGPLSELDEDTFWESASDAEYAINGLYESFYELEGGTDLWKGLGGAPYRDCMLDLMFFRDNYKWDGHQLGAGNATPGNGHAKAFWETKFLRLRDCNVFFENIDRIKNLLTEDKYNELVGQARVARAFLHLRLVQAFGDAPLLTRSLKYNEKPSRTPATEVMSFVINELTQAIKELPDKPSDQLHGRIYKDVARAYLARAAMHYAGFYGKTEHYQTAKDALEPIVTNTAYELWKHNSDPSLNLQELFWSEFEGNMNKEIIFSYQFVKDNYPNNISTCFAGDGWKVHQVTQNMIDLYEPQDGGWQKWGISYKEMNEYRDAKEKGSPLVGKWPDYDPKDEFKGRDPRMSATLMNGSPKLNEKGEIVKEGEFWEPGNRQFNQGEWGEACYSLKKMVDPICFKNGYYFGNAENNFPLVRLADMLLLYAEVLNELGETEEALPYVNMVRDRATMPPVEASDKEELLEIIKHERKIELLAEDILVWDYKRWKEYERTMPYGAKYYGFRKENFGKESFLFYQKNLIFPKAYLWPIPTSELTVNSNIEQNPGW